jgi:hypothetical protein
MVQVRLRYGLVAPLSNDLVPARRLSSIHRWSASSSFQGVAAFGDMLDCVDRYASDRRGANKKGGDLSTAALLPT